ncbi:MAG TPA: SdrD B-like domain-containing protein, partial [Roseiflexaceae bacterium]|nr:SdrD B-like domain-containing protein [Roseiflexaceae bacterium]
MRSNLKAVGLACIILSFFGAVLASIGEDSPPAAAQSNQPGHLLAPASVLAGQQPLTPTPGASGNRPQGIIIITNTPTRTPTPINIGNFVWDDINQDGNQDAGEAGVPNVTVELYGTQGLIDSTVTNASGLYSLTAPTPGDYRVRVRLPSILDHFTAKDQGDDLKDSDINPSGLNTGYTDVFTLASNVISITRIDAGIVVYRPPTATRTPTPINIGN